MREGMSWLCPGNTGTGSAGLQGRGTRQRLQPLLSVHGGTGANLIVWYTLCERGDNVVSVLPNYQMFYSIPEFLGKHTNRRKYQRQTSFCIILRNHTAIRISNGDDWNEN